MAVAEQQGSRLPAAVVAAGPFRPVSLWRPRIPPGYIGLGDCAQMGYEPPVTPVAFSCACDEALQAPLGSHALLWRGAGQRRGGAGDGSLTLLLIMKDSSLIIIAAPAA